MKPTSTYSQIFFFIVFTMIAGTTSFRHTLLSRRTTRTISAIILRSIISPGGMEEEQVSSSEAIIEIPTRNVLGGRLQACCFQPKTGFYRDGFCQTGPEDDGKHTVCVRVDQTFLNFSKSKGNDLSTPYPMYGFPGLKPDDCWCLCAGRWKEAFLEGKAPSVVLSATHEKTLEIVTLEQLLLHASGDNTSEDEMQ